MTRMIENVNPVEQQSPDISRQPAHNANQGAHNGAGFDVPTMSPGSHPTMLAAVREMLSLAIEGAFDLRTGREHSRHLQRFDEMLEEQIGVLKSLENGVFTTDPGFLMRRAQEALHGFAAVVRHEIVEDVRPGMNPTVFDAALQRMTDRAVMAGAAFASLDLALEQI